MVLIWRRCSGDDCGDELKQSPKPDKQVYPSVVRLIDAGATFRSAARHGVTATAQPTRAARSRRQIPHRWLPGC